MDEKVENTNTSGIVHCPECEHSIPLNVDWQEDDTFVCPNCSADIQVVSVDPLMVDFAPEVEENWKDSDDPEPLGLDEAEELEVADEDEVDDEAEWDGPVSRRVATLRSARSRPQPRKESSDTLRLGVTYLTPEGEARLRQELWRLQNERLPKVMAWLSDALSEGFEDEDVTELEEARSELSFIEGRIRGLESLLATVEHLPEPENKEIVQMGSRVTVVEGDSEPETYRIVSPAEADPLNGYISDVSPLGKALIGHQVGNHVVVSSPDGPIEFCITKIG